MPAEYSSPLERLHISPLLTGLFRSIPGGVLPTKMSNRGPQADCDLYVRKTVLFSTLNKQKECLFMGRERRGRKREWGKEGGTGRNWAIERQEAKSQRSKPIWSREALGGRGWCEGKCIIGGHEWGWSNWVLWFYHTKLPGKDVRTLRAQGLLDVNQ